MQRSKHPINHPFIHSSIHLLIRSLLYNWFVDLFYLFLLISFHFRKVETHATWPHFYGRKVLHICTLLRSITTTATTTAKKNIVVVFLFTLIVFLFLDFGLFFCFCDRLRNILLFLKEVTRFFFLFFQELPLQGSDFIDYQLRLFWGRQSQNIYLLLSLSYMS